MARIPTPKTKAEIKLEKAGLKDALKKSAETLVPFKAAAVAAARAVTEANKAVNKAAAAYTKAAAKLEKATAAHAKGAEKIGAKLAALNGTEG